MRNTFRCFVSILRSFKERTPTAAGSFLSADDVAAKLHQALANLLQTGTTITVEKSPDADLFWIPRRAAIPALPLKVVLFLRR